MRGPSRFPLVWLAFIAALIATILLLAVRNREHRRSTVPDESLPATPGSVISIAPDATSSASEPTPPFAERILADFAAASLPPERDLDAISRVLGNFMLLVKGDSPLPLGANEEIAAALRGKNRAHLRALPDNHRAFNARGQLIDRWDTPLYFHAESRDRLDIRSAGPDRVMWTADDLHRTPDGRFLRGAALLAPSLFEGAGRGR